MFFKSNSRANCKKMSYASGSIRAKGVSFGPNTNDSLTVSDTTGQVAFKIGDPTVTVPEVYPLLRSPVYSTIPSTNIDSSTNVTDSVNILNNCK